MPPAAIASSVFATIAARVVVVAPAAGSSSVGAGGNFGARAPAAVERVEVVAERARGRRERRVGERLARGLELGRARDRRGERARLVGDVVAPVAVDVRRRRSSTWRNEGRPWRGSGGKYVPPKNGSPAGVRKTVIGQPPPPVSATTASM